MQDGPLDMRMEKSGRSAADVVNGAPLARFISRFRKSVETASLLGEPAVD